MHDITPEDRRLCVVLAYSLMTLRERNVDRFEAIVETIFDSVPEAASVKRGRAMLRELLIINGGKIAQALVAAGLMAGLADDIYRDASHHVFAFLCALCV